MQKKIILIITFLVLIVINIIFFINKTDNKTMTIKEKNKIAIIFDGVEESSFPSKEDYVFEKVVCDGEEINSTDTGTTSFNINITSGNKTSRCEIYFKTFSYNYGDGSLNTVNYGYNGVVKVNGQTMFVPSDYLGNGNYSGFQANTSPGSSITDDFISYFGSQFDGSYSNPIGVWSWHATNDTGKSLQYIYSGTKNYTLASPITGERTVYFHTMAAYLTGSLNLQNLKFLVNGTYYTLEQMVTNNLIYPIVLIGSQYRNYIYQTPLNLYTGGSTGNGSYSYWRTLFMTKEGTTITGFTLTASKTTNANDGFGVGSTAIENFRMTIE